MGKALIVTDMQKDFMQGGALAVPRSEEIVPIINALMEHFDLICAVEDWHPPHHVSFASTHHKRPGEVILAGSAEQMLWSDHCVQNTRGAELASGLWKQKIGAFFHKGSDPYIDSYSAFFDNARRRSTGLAAYLHQHQCTSLYFVGVATDYCILYSVLDALELGFQTAVVVDACRAINRQPEDERFALEKMQHKGALLVNSANPLDNL